MLPFDEEIDANAAHILNKSDCDTDNEEYSENENLNYENLEFYQAKK